MIWPTVSELVRGGTRVVGPAYYNFFQRAFALPFSGAGPLVALLGLVAANRRRYGGYLVHVAIVLFAIGIAGSNSYQTIKEGTLRQGESLSVRGYSLAYRGAFEREAANKLDRRASIDVSDRGRTLGKLEPGKNAYAAEALFSTEVAIRTNWLTGEDLFVVAQQFNDDGSVYLRVFVKPLVNLLRLGGLLFVFGSVVAMWPDAREQRRLAQRYVSAAPPPDRPGAAASA